MIVYVDYGYTGKLSSESVSCNLHVFVLVRCKFEEAFYTIEFVVGYSELLQAKTARLIGKHPIEKLPETTTREAPARMIS